MHVRKIAPAAITVALLSLAACSGAGEDDENKAADVVDAQVNALEQAAEMTHDDSTANVLKEEANEVREIDEAREDVRRRTETR